jgi:hypothetical protein
MRRVIYGETTLPRVVRVPEQIIRQRLSDILVIMARMEEHVLHKVHVVADWMGRRHYELFVITGLVHCI